MKSTIAITVASAAILMGLSTAASAAGISQRQDRQSFRIERGIESGQLTRYEVKKLRKEQRDIDELKRCLKRYGGRGLQPMERRVLQRLLNVASQNIRELKHNGDRRYTNRRKNQGQRNSHGGRHHDQPSGKYSWLRTFKF